ncbi:AAA family ATPase [bacterium]|nr:AAA family ATPase [bacterium]
MKIEAIKVKNFKAFKDITIENIPSFCVFVGANGSGKSTIFSILEFLKEAFHSNINIALNKIGGSKGFLEVRSRDSKGPIDIEIQFRQSKKAPLITYQLIISENSGKSYVEREILKYRRGGRGKPWHFLDFSKGVGNAVTNELDNVKDINDLIREEQKLKSNDILAIKGLAQFEKFPAVKDLGNLIENWHISDIKIDKARLEQESGYSEHLTRHGENLSLVIQYLNNNHPTVLDQIFMLMKQRIPGITNVESKTTEEGRVLLKFQDGSFEDPFLARFVSDGTIKMLAYLILLYDPSPHPLLCVEEPEKQLYPKLLWELAEEFRSYANRGEQVFVTTHSPEFLNATAIEEVFWLEKENGYTTIKKASNNEQLLEYMKNGDQMGYLWKHGLFGDID